MPSTLPRRALVAFLLAAAGCKTVDYVPVDQYRQPPDVTEATYVIRPGDIVQVRVMGQETISTRAKVRPDGKISVPLLKDVPAAGVTPPALAQSIQDGLSRFIVNPSVTVSLEEPRALMVSVLGEVAKVGTYPLEQGSGLLEALAAAGGPTQYAALDRIMVIRKEATGERIRIRVDYESLTRLRGGAATFRLQNGDVVVVE